MTDNQVGFIIRLDANYLQKGEVLMKDINLSYIIIFCIIITATLFGLSQPNLPKATASDNNLKIAVGIPPIRRFVEEVGGDKVETIVMIPPGYSPANYAPGPKKMTKLSDSDIYFSTGMPAEKTGILPKLKSFNKDLETVRLDQLVFQKYSVLRFSDGGKDPHIWLSPKRVKYMIDLIGEKFQKIDPENSSYYQKRAEDYLERLSDMDRYIEDRLQKLKRKQFLIYHPVLGYFADEYGLEMKVIEENGKEAAPKRLMEIIDFAKNNNIKAVFYQSTIDSRQTDVIADEIKAMTVEINPLAEDYIKNMKKITDLIYKYSN